MFLIFASTNTVFYIAFALCFRHYGNIKFSYVYIGKSESGPFFYLTADILTKVYKTVPRVVLWQTYELCSSGSICWVAMATKIVRKKIR